MSSSAPHDGDPLLLLKRWESGPHRELREALLHGEPIPRGSDLRGIDLRRARLSARSLQAARLDLARLDETDLAGADLSDACIQHATAVEARLERASLRHAEIGGTNLAGADLREADLQDAAIHGTVLAGADLRAVKLLGARLLECDLGGAWLWGAGFDRRDRNRGGNDSRLESLASEPGAMVFLRGRSAIAARAAEGVGWAIDDLDAELLRALTASDWRLQLVACAVACFAADRIRSREAIGRELEASLRRGSWVSPQIAAAWSLLEPDFKTSAAALAAVTSDTKCKTAIDALLGIGIGGEGGPVAAAWRESALANASAPARAAWVVPAGTG